MIKFLKRVFLFLPVFFLACQSPDTVLPNSGPPPIPYNSATMISFKSPGFHLGHDAFDALGKYLLGKYQCSSFTIDKVTDANSDRSLMIDDYGRLLKGKISERWELTICGKRHDLGMVFTPDGHKGTYVGIAEIK